MKEITVSTNLHCNSCVAKLATVLDKDSRIQRWHAEVQKPDKPVTVHGNIERKEVEALIQKAGFATHTAVPESEKSLKRLQRSFWKDQKIWKRASFNTLNCLIGCTIGDFAMIIYLQVYHPGTPMWLQMILAIMAGLITSIMLETTLLHYREKLIWRSALKMAISMSFISMIGMELAMNITDFMITGGKAMLSSPSYWLAFIPAAVAGFLAPLPYNYYQLKKHNRACH